MPSELLVDLVKEGVVGAASTSRDTRSMPCLTHQRTALYERAKTSAGALTAPPRSSHPRLALGFRTPGPGAPQRNLIAALALAALASGLITPTRLSAEPFYIGKWNIVSAAVAPWWEDPSHRPDPSESASLVGKSVTFEPDRILGPPQVTCSAPKYRVRNYPADWLFQGEFGEMHLRNKAVEPAKIAALVGFSKGTSWKTVETECGNELDYHFIDDKTAAFGLNNYIYILKKR